MTNAKRTILLYGRTNAGKTAQVGELAEYVFTTTGKKTRLYTVDRGGLDTIRPYVDLGIVDAVELNDSDPWVFLNKAVRGYVRDDKGKWVLDEARNATIGLWAFESMRAFAEEMKLSMINKIRAGVNIGGGANISFQTTDAASGESLKVSGGNMAIFGQAQDRVVEELWESHKLPGQFILWTSSVSKDDDLNSAGKILGPDVIGKALTGEIPRMMNLTFRIDVIAAQAGGREKHVLYLGNHVDVGAGNASGLGNTRLPLDAKPPEKITIEPASIVQALKILDSGYATAKEAIQKRLGDKLKTINSK